MSDDAVSILSILIVGLFFVGLVIFGIWSANKSCDLQWTDFEHNYKVFQGCRIKVNNKWIPASSYYFKEE